MIPKQHRILCLSLIAFLGTSERDFTSAQELSKVAVVRGDLQPTIVANGRIVSRESTEIRNQVESANEHGRVIIQLVPEGSFVQEGDLLVLLDSADLEDRKNQLQIQTLSALAEVNRIKDDLKEAQFAKQAYVESTLPIERYGAETRLLSAQHQLRISKRTLIRIETDPESANRDEELNDAQTAVDLANRAVELATMKKTELENFKWPQSLLNLDKNVNRKEPLLRAAEMQHEIMRDQLELTSEFISKCEILASRDGFVIYADNWRDRDWIDPIEEGSSVRERQLIMEICTLGEYDVETRFHESVIDLVAVGTQTQVRVLGIADENIMGHVNEIGRHPLRPGRYASGDLEYGATIRLDSTHPELRPGMSAEVTGMSRHLKDVLMVPKTSVFGDLEQGSGYCLVWTDGGWRLRNVGVGPSNEHWTVITQGLDTGDQVADQPPAGIDRFGAAHRRN